MLGSSIRSSGSGWRIYLFVYLFKETSEIFLSASEKQRTYEVIKILPPGVRCFKVSTTDKQTKWCNSPPALNGCLSWNSYHSGFAVNI